jgi:hypothetical protein
VAKQLLHSADIDAGIEQVRREGMTECVGSHLLLNCRCPNCPANCSADSLFEQVMTSHDAGAGIGSQM